MKANIEGKVIEFCIVSQDEIEPGVPCLVSIDDLLVLGDYYPNVDGFDYVAQPGRIIQIKPED